MLMWLVGASLALAAVPAKQVPHALERIQDEVGGRVLVVAPSFGTKSYVEGFARHSGSRAAVVDGGGHDDVCEALEDSGLKAAVVVRSAPAGAWELEVVDDCFPEPEPEVEPLPTAEEIVSESRPSPPPRRVEAPEPPVTSPPPAAPPPPPPAAPAPTTEIRTVGLTSAQMRSLMALEAEAPDPTTALLASAFVGFGAGHFYAGDPQRGAIHAGIQGSGVLFFVGGLLAKDVDTAMALSNLGYTILAVGRLADIYTAPQTAHEQAARKIRKFR